MSDYGKYRSKDIAGMNIEDFRAQLIDKYKGTFSAETEEKLKGFEDDYDMACLNSAIHLVQMCSGISSKVFCVFRKVSYTEYKKFFTEKDATFIAVFGEVLYDVQEELSELITCMPSVYEHMVGTEVTVNFAATKTLKVSEYMSNVHASYLEIPILLTRAALNMYDVLTILVNEKKNEKTKTSHIKTMLLSAIIIAGQALYNILFSPDDDDDEDDSD